MIFTSTVERTLADTVARLIYTNPLLPERIEFERAALGGAFTEGDAVWNALSDPMREASNVAKIGERAELVVASARERLAERVKASAQDLSLYEQLVFYVLYHRSREQLATLVTGDGEANEIKAPFYADFARD